MLFCLMLLGLLLCLVCFLLVCVVDFASFLFLKQTNNNKTKKGKINKQHMSIMNCL